MSKPRDFSLTFGGAGSQEINAAGRYLYVLSTPEAPVYIALDGGSELLRGAGQAIFDAEGFQRFSVRSTVAQTVLVSVSRDEQADSRSNVALEVTASVEPGNDIDNGGDVTCGADASTQVLAADPTRLAAVITNPVDNTDAVRVGGAGVDDESGLPLEPGESVTLATTAAIFIYSPSDQTVSAVAVRSV